MMYVDMIEDIVKDLKAKYGIDEIDVEYDFMPANTGSIIEGINLLLEDETRDWVATGEIWIIPSKIGNDRHIQIILLKRGVEISFIIPQSFDKTANEETKQ